MNPVPTFRATITEQDGDANVAVELMVAPTDDRGALLSEAMPTAVLASAEFLKLFGSADVDELVGLVDASRRDQAREAIVALRVPGATAKKAKLVRELVPSLSESARSLLTMRPKRIKTTPSKYRRR
jgi:hypothetical protein